MHRADPLGISQALCLCPKGSMLRCLELFVGGPLVLQQEGSVLCGVWEGPAHCLVTTASCLLMDSLVICELG